LRVRTRQLVTRVPLADQ